jgi:hypothetical protein
MLPKSKNWPLMRDQTLVKLQDPSILNSLKTDLILWMRIDKIYIRKEKGRSPLISPSAWPWRTLFHCDNVVSASPSRHLSVHVTSPRRVLSDWFCQDTWVSLLLCLESKYAVRVFIEFFTFPNFFYCFIDVWRLLMLQWKNECKIIFYP